MKYGQREFLFPVGTEVTPLPGCSLDEIFNRLQLEQGPLHIKITGHNSYPFGHYYKIVFYSKKTSYAQDGIYHVSKFCFLENEQMLLPIEDYY